MSATGGAAGLLTSEAAATNGTVHYTFVAGSPGTYLYESGSDVGKQLEMGLYGALIVRPATGANYAYGTSTQFDPSREYLLLLSEIDPDLHHAVETGGTYDINSRRDRYFAVNGREFPDTIQDNGSALLPNQPYGSLVRIQPNTGPNTQPALIRMINAGALNHPFHPHGNHTTQIAQDGRLLLSPSGGSAATEHFGETIASGQTAGLPAALGRHRQLEPGHQPAAGRATELPQRVLQGQQHLVRRKPVPGLQGHAADRGHVAEHLRRVVLPVAQPRPQRVRQLRRRLRWHGHPAAGRPARRLLRLVDVDQPRRRRS